MSTTDTPVVSTAANLLQRTPNPAQQQPVPVDVFRDLLASLGTISGPFVSVKDPQFAGGAKGDGVTDDRPAIASALLSVANGGTILFPKTILGYAINPTLGALLIPSNVTIDFGGNTITRIGSDFTTRMFQNLRYGVTQDTNIVIKNGILVGTGAVGQTSDQGSCIGLYKADRYTIENIETQNSNGDGIQLRQATGGRIAHVRIGNYGRNGMSPTSGSCQLIDVEITGTAISGANPGHDLDFELAAGGETGDWVLEDVRAYNLCTFLDAFTAGSGVFAHKVKIIGCRFGPSFKALRFISTNATTTTDIDIDETTTMLVGGGQASTTGLWIEKVGGVRTSAQIISDGSGAARVGITTVGTVPSFYATGVKEVGSFTKGVIAFAVTDLLTGVFRGCDLSDVFLTGSNSLFEDTSMGALTISQAASINNVFGPTCRFTSTTFSNGALVGSNVFATPVAWTPVVAGSTGAGTATYTTQSGYVAQVGSIVYFNLELTYTGHTGTGNLTITGLPYTAGGSGRGRGAFAIYASSLVWTAANQLTGIIADSATTIQLFNYPEAGGGAAAVAMDAAATLRISGFYFV